MSDGGALSLTPPPARKTFPTFPAAHTSFQKGALAALIRGGSHPAALSTDTGQTTLPLHLSSEPRVCKRSRFTNKENQQSRNKTRYREVMTYQNAENNSPTACTDGRPRTGRFRSRDAEKLGRPRPSGCPAGVRTPDCGRHRHGAQVTQQFHG